MNTVLAYYSTVNDVYGPTLRKYTVAEFSEELAYLLGVHCKIERKVVGKLSIDYLQTSFHVLCFHINSEHKESLLRLCNS